MAMATAGGERVVAVVPARWGSTRFPGKALALLEGTPIIVHALRRASEARCVQRVIAAVDDELRRLLDEVPIVALYSSVDTGAVRRNVSGYAGWALGQPRLWGVSFAN